MEPENPVPHHLSAEEHQLHAIEEQLLKDGRQWLSRAAELYSHTSKVKIWVPVICTMLLSGYSLYNMHMRALAASAPLAAESGPVAVAVTEDSPASKAPQSATASSAVIATAAVEADVSTAGDNSDGDLLKRAQQARNGQQFGEEASLLQKVFDHSQSAPQVCPEIGKAYERAGELASSIRAFEQCASLAPGDVDTLVAFAHALQAKPDFARASTVLRQCLAKDPGNLDAQTGLALVELKQNHLKQADEGVLAILRKAPDNTDALLIAGMVAWRESRLADAERIFSKGAGLDDRRADFHAFLGRIAEAERRPQDALQQYEKALSLDPADADIADRRDRLRDMR